MASLMVHQNERNSSSMLHNFEGKNEYMNSITSFFEETLFTNSF